MYKKILIEFFALLAIIAVVAFAFYKWQYLPKNSLNLLSIEREVELGKVIDEQIGLFDSNYKTLENKKLDSAIDIISTRLIEALDSPLYSFNIKVVESEQINAVTLPGGNIYLFKGLINFSESPEEVAAILAHEIGHAQERHIVSRLIKQTGIAVLFTALGGGDPQLISQVMQLLIQNVFNRQQEEDADEFGMNLLVKAKIEPSHLANFFARLEEHGKTYNENLEVFMTHPHHNNRVNKVNSFQLPENFKPYSFSLNWTEIKQSLD